LVHSAAAITTVVFAMSLAGYERGHPDVYTTLMEEGFLWQATMQSGQRNFWGRSG
jgi:hypothetical protein